MNKWKYLLIYVLFAAVLAVIVFMIWVGTAQSSDCTWFQGKCYYPYPMPEIGWKVHFPLVFANAYPTVRPTPTLAPTMNPFPTITYPPPVTPVP